MGENPLESLAGQLTGYFADVDDDKALALLRDDIDASPHLDWVFREGLNALLSGPSIDCLGVLQRCANRQADRTEEGARAWLADLRKALFGPLPVDDALLKELCLELGSSFDPGVDDEKAIPLLRGDLYAQPGHTLAMRNMLHAVLADSRVECLPIVEEYAKRRVGGTEAGARSWLAALLKALSGPV
jgi:hypothetical protein